MNSATAASLKSYLVSDRRTSSNGTIGISFCRHAPVILALQEIRVLQDLRASVATSRLQAAVGQASANRLFILSAVSDVRRTGSCGNQVCEAGERFSVQGPVGMHKNLFITLQPMQKCAFTDRQNAPRRALSAKTCSKAAYHCWTHNLAMCSASKLTVLSNV